LEVASRGARAARDAVPLPRRRPDRRRSCRRARAEVCSRRRLDFARWSEFPEIHSQNFRNPQRAFGRTRGVAVTRDGRPRYARTHVHARPPTRLTTAHSADAIASAPSEIKGREEEEPTRERRRDRERSVGGKRRGHENLPTRERLRDRKRAGGGQRR